MSGASRRTSAKIPTRSRWFRCSGARPARRYARAEGSHPKPKPQPRRAASGARGSSGVWHLRRPKLSGCEPLHITMRLRDDVPNLRKDEIFFHIQRAFLGGKNRFGMRLIDFSILHNHMHFIVEAGSKHALSKGMQGL